MSWKIGDLCVAKSEQFGWTNSEIKQINEDVANVEFIEYGDNEEVNISDLKLFGPFAVNKMGELVEGNNDAGGYAGWKVGDACVAQWAQDGAWYNSQILHFFNEDEILVRFVVHGNADFTTLVSLKPAGSSLEKAVYQSLKSSFPSKNDSKTEVRQLKHGDVLEECDEVKTSWKVGDLCVALWTEDKIWYNSQIIEIKGDSILVRFTDYGNEDYTTLDQLKPFGSLDEEFTHVKKTLSRNERDNKWKVGDLCVAQWNEDLIWYDSEIVEIDGENVLVRFVEYGNEDYTTLEELKPAGALLNEDYTTLEELKPSNAEGMNKEKTWAVGDLCVAQWEEDRIWYNSKILEIHGEKVLVRFVDYGNEDFARLSKLKPAGTLQLEDVINEKGAIPKVKKGATTKIKKGTVPKVKISASEKQLPTSEEKRSATEEEISVFYEYSMRNYMSTAEDIAKQLENMFPDFSPEFLLDKVRKYGTIEIAVNELLNYVQDQDLLKEDKNNCVKERVAKSLLLLNEQDMFAKVTLTEKRDFNPDDPLDNKFRLAKGHYLSVSGQFARPIESIDYVENRILMEIFERKKSQFKSERKDAKEYFLFHGTDNVNVDSILLENFQMDYAGKHGQVHGRGIYFSEKTAIPDKYMNGSKKTLLLCRVLLGKEFDGVDNNIPEGFDSKSIRPDEDKRADINVIKEVDQILPCFVLNLGTSAGDNISSGRRGALLSFRTRIGASSAIPFKFSNVPQIGASNFPRGLTSSTDSKDSASVYLNRKGRVIKIIDENYGVLACAVGQDQAISKGVYQVIFDVHDVWIGYTTLKDIGKTLKDVINVGDYVMFNGVHLKDMKKGKKRCIQDLATALVIAKNESFVSLRFPAIMVPIKKMDQIQEKKLNNFKVMAKVVGDMELAQKEHGILASLVLGL